ncbi:MAG: PfkB family carbohydrate kinase [Jhaorihella sp.]
MRTPIHIAGGLYREICLHPAWNTLLGSGGRAAQALTALGDKTILHSYFEDDQSIALEPYRDSGITLELMRRQSPIAFAYFHPLSTPHLEPSDIAQESAFHVNAETVLRFGLVEGDAVVRARRAIFDPQGTCGSLHLRRNGSEADETTLILNARELISGTGISDLEDAARSLVNTGAASVVIVKRGVFGALVIESGKRTTFVPAFRSPNVFKIGTGDVFSATFAHYWGLAGEDAATAAEQASLAVAYYVQNRDFPTERQHPISEPVGGVLRGPVAVLAASNTLGNKYVLEETLHRLGELGVHAEHVHTPPTEKQHAAVLVIVDGLSRECIADAVALSISGQSIIMLDETQSLELENLRSKVIRTRDFTSALYQAAWAASTPRTI